MKSVTIDNVEQAIADAVRAYGLSTDRGAQSKAGIMGPSDLGFCRSKSYFMTVQQEWTDDPTIWSAQVGTAIHAYLADALADAFPEWDCHPPRLTATFPSGAEVAGTPDVIAPDINAVLDHKTTDGLSYVKAKGTSQNHRYQRHTYALAAIQAGLLDDTRPVFVGNVYWDRSGKEPRPYVSMEEFDPTLTAEIDSWIADVIYAVQHGPDHASKDVPAPVCEAIGCEFYGACRGDLPIADGADFISDPEIVSAVDLYVEGREMAKAGEAMKRDAQKMLAGVNGTTGEWTVRWVQIAGAEVPGYVRPPSMRLDVRRPRNPGI